ncbi:hypothetical protein JX266_006479 [Neoarthrinium moseri]|nr:hypothetical protein JX266_006479 [Neoarthrinium moseri]
MDPNLVAMMKDLEMWEPGSWEDGPETPSAAPPRREKVTPGPAPPRRGPWPVPMGSLGGWLLWAFQLSIMGLWRRCTWPMILVVWLQVAGWIGGSGLREAVEAGISGPLPPLDPIFPDNNSLAFAAVALDALCAPLVASFASPHIVSDIRDVAATLRDDLQDGRRLAKALPRLSRDVARRTAGLESDVRAAKKQVDLLMPQDSWLAFPEVGENQTVLVLHTKDGQARRNAITLHPGIASATGLILSAKDELGQALEAYARAVSDVQQLQDSISGAHDKTLRSTRALTQLAKARGIRSKLGQVALWFDQWFPYLGMVLQLMDWDAVYLDEARFRAFAGALGTAQWAAVEMQQTVAGLEALLDQVEWGKESTAPRYHCLHYVAGPGQALGVAANLLADCASRFHKHTLVAGPLYADALSERFTFRPGGVLGPVILWCWQCLVRAADRALLCCCRHWRRFQQVLVVFSGYKVLTMVYGRHDRTQ